MRLRSLPLAIALVAVAAALPASAQQSAAELEPVTSVEGITEYQLDNGLRVLLFPDPTKPQITVNITYLVGSRHEGYGETGMAHLLEHLLGEQPVQWGAGLRTFPFRQTGEPEWGAFLTLSFPIESPRWRLAPGD